MNLRKSSKQALRDEIARAGQSVSRLTSDNGELRDHLTELLRDDLMRQYHALHEYSYAPGPLEWVMHPKWRAFLHRLTDSKGVPFLDSWNTGGELHLLGSPVTANPYAKSPELRRVKR